MDQSVFEATVLACASKQFHPNLVSSSVMFEVLRSVIVAGEQVDAVKRALFYGKAQPDLQRKVAHSEMLASFDFEHIQPNVLHAILGLITEAAELADRACQMALEPEAVNAHQTNLDEEQGDIEWYMALLYIARSRFRPNVLVANNRKLEARFGPAFTSEAALNRDLTAEQKALQGSGKNGGPTNTDPGGAFSNE